MKDILIAITDDDNLIAQLLQDFLNKSPGYNVLFTASDGNDLVAKLKDCNEMPDVLLLDLKMEGMNGIDTTQFLKIHYPKIKIIIISSHYQHSFLNFMFTTGASAFVPKGISLVLVKEIITTVHTQGVFFMDDQLEKMKEQATVKVTKPNLTDHADLSEREIDVLKLISMQKTAKEIGEMLFITGRTVEGHKNSLFIKTGAKNIAGLVVYAIQQNIISVKDMPRI